MKKITVLLVAFLAVLSTRAQTEKVPSTNAIVAAATAQAAKENKNVFILFHASWCIWCHRMDAYMNDPRCKAFFDKNYVIAHITVMEDPKHKADENEGGRQYLFDHGGQNTGIPYWIILGKDGKYLANSRQTGEAEALTSDNGDNVGCPGEEDEIAYFLRVLKSTSNASAADLDAVKSAFTKK